MYIIITRFQPVQPIQLLSEARHLLPASFLPRPHGHMPTGLLGNHKKLPSDIHSNKWDVCQEVNSGCFRYGFNP